MLEITRRRRRVYGLRSHSWQLALNLPHAVAKSSPGHRIEPDLPIAPLVQAGMMFDDEDRYNMGLPTLLDPPGDAQ